ncbi:MAG TPA: glycosyltransferase [Bryobacteraceae bacterium]|nr:glycosyltransferase [Bryobacteraceae bacterium]
MRVLFCGENWFGSCARACSAALRRLGCDVFDLDAQTFFPQWRSRELRAVRRLLRPRIIADFNATLLAAAESYRPHLLLAFKGNFILPSTVRSLRERGIRTYNYYPDRVIFARNSPLEEALGEYDCVFDTKRSWDGDMAKRLRLRDRVVIPHGYDAEIHRPTPIAKEDATLFGSEVSFVGTYTERKERLLDELVWRRSSLAIRIFGNDWKRCRSPLLKKRVQGTAVNGQSYAKAIAASRINLAIMGVSDDALDETTTRTYEIPACGGFMLHERTEEVLTLYEENREVVCFSSADELASKIDHYLKHPSQAKKIAEAGYRRAVPNYSYDHRVRQILEYHETSLGAACA